jgi:predicted dehydrogenase
MTTPLRAGIIGLSWIAADPAGIASVPELGSAQPYSHASAFEAIGDIEVRAVCDISSEAREAFVSRWSHRWPNVDTFDDLDRMLETPLDLVSVVTPDHLHGPMIMRCLDAGVPMIFAEKPFTTDLAEADRILAKIAAVGASVGINHTWRWRPEVGEALSIVRGGALGPLSHIVIEAGGPRAMLYRNLSHFLDLAIHLADSEPRWVIGELEAGHDDYGLSYAGDGGRDPERDPGATATIGFETGARAHVSGLKSAVPDVVIQVVCRDGRITIDTLGARTVSVPRTGNGTPGAVSGPVIQPLKPRFSITGMQAAFTDLIDARRRGVEPSSSARSARRTVAVIDAILRSHATDSRRVEVR